MKYIKKWINSAKKNEFVKREISRFKLIQAEPNLFKKILKYFWEWAIMLFKFVWFNRHDKALMISCLISFVLVSSSVWLPALIALFTKGWVAMIGVATTGIGIWNLPGTPFLLIVLGLGLANKAIYIKFIKPINLRDNAWYN